MTNWLVGEYGDTLRVTMPFSIAGAEVSLMIRPPAQQAWRAWIVDEVEDLAVEHVILEGELAAVGLYHGVVEVLTPGRLRKAIFSISVGGQTSRG